MAVPPPWLALQSCSFVLWGLSSLRSRHLGRTLCLGQGSVPSLPFSSFFSAASSSCLLPSRTCCANDRETSWTRSRPQGAGGHGLNRAHGKARPEHWVQSSAKATTALAPTIAERPAALRLRRLQVSAPKTMGQTINPTATGLKSAAATTGSTRRKGPGGCRGPWPWTAPCPPEALMAKAAVEKGACRSRGSDLEAPFKCCWESHSS